MKYAFMTASCPDESFDELLHLVRQYGYDGLEIRVASHHGHGIEYDLDASGRAAARQAANDAGVTLCALATSCRFADPATLEEAVSDARLAIDLAGDLGIPILRIFGGVIGGGLSREEAAAQVAKAILSLTDQAEKRKVCLAIETHDDWCDPADMIRILEKVDHPAVGVVWDLMHPVMTAKRSIDQAFQALRRWIIHVHFHDGFWQEGNRIMTPIGEGVVDHRRALELLQEANYNGYMSGEWIRWKPHAEHLPQELIRLRQLENVVRGSRTSLLGREASRPNN